MSKTDSTYVSASVVERIFRISDETRRKWKHAGFLVPDKPQTNLYSTAAIDQLLARQARGFETPPTTASLVNGEVTLITTPEVCKQLGMSSFAVNTLLRHAHIAAIKLIAGWRVSEASVVAYNERRNSVDFLTQAQARHVLSVTPPIIRTLLADNRLKIQKVEGVNRVRSPITRISLLQLLRELLPGWIDPEDWLEDRLESQRPLLPQYEACRQLGITWQAFWPLVATQRLQVISRFGGPGVRVSAESVEAYLSYSGHIMSPTELARLYGVARPSVEQWYKTGKIPDCPIRNHVHNHPQWFFGSCWLAILETSSSPGFQPMSWYRTRMSGKSTSRTLSLEQMAQGLSMNPQTLAQLAQEGKIMGLLTPANQWRFSQRTLKRKKPLYAQHRPSKN